MTDEITRSCLPCGLHQPRRNTYFDGKMLLERDFVDEQDYHRGHRHLHNSLLHGAGAVCGLKVVQHPSEACRRDFVVVEPGMALDCCGQEIIVPGRSLVPVRRMLDDDPDLAGALDGRRHLVLGVRRCDHGAEPVPAILPGCEGLDGPAEYGRVAEGFEFVLSARAPTELARTATPLRPRLSWVHTIALGGQLPRKVHLNEAVDLVLVAADTPGGSHLYVHDDGRNDLVALLEGPHRATDTVSLRELDLLAVAGSGFEADGTAVNGVRFWRRAELRTGAGPVGLLPVEGPAARLAVSPVSGTLFVLDLLGDARAELRSYSTDALREWLAAGAPGDALPGVVQRLELPHGFGGENDPALRGAAMMQFSHDGRHLALASSGPDASQGVYLVDVSAGTDLTAEDALAEGIDQGGHAVALAWSLDSAFLYLLSQVTDGPGRAVVSRYALTGIGTRVERQGRGASLEGMARDLAVAPTETRAYVLLDDPDGVSRFTTVDMERVKAVDAAGPEPLELSADTIRIEGDGRSLAMAANGGRLYVAAADDDPEAPPDRGLVAVVDVEEDDCSVHIERQIDGCPSCGTGRHRDRGAGHVVVLGHLPLYTAADRPRMMDPDGAEETDSAIDNLTHRMIVPSAQSLRDTISCMLARGIDEGPPGPRGDPGADGTDGLSVTEVEVELGAPGSAPVADVVANEEGLTLRLEMPAAPPGATGPGIDDARIEYVDGLQEPAVSIVTEGGRRVLDIDLPTPRQHTPAPAVNPIIAMSWVHGEEYPVESGSFIEDLNGRGIAVAFKAPVPWKLFAAPREGTPTMLVELQRSLPFEGHTELWASVQPLEVRPITIRDEDIDGVLLRSWEEPDDADASPGFLLRGRIDKTFERGEVLRFVFYSDFLVDVEGRPVSGAHIEGQLPTGRGGPGGTFRSWFTITRP